ncbi:MAG: 30S ribosome-binding factor RbfA [Gammaproteobacteria bacterium]|nr:MAG: 30S ribosome-binding factor RbfA [Gammaproteobacteria bacterium]
MARDYPRSRRVADQLQRDLSDLIRNEVKDPRLGMITVSEVIVSKDLAYAKVYISELGADIEKNRESVDILNGAAGFLRRELGFRLRLRLTPALTFVHDDSFEKASALDGLISQALASDCVEDTEE